jgi:hypothetical protein
MEQRDREEDVLRRVREKSRLRLASEEKVLFIGEPSLWRYWPAVLSSGIALAASVWGAPGTKASFIYLFFGLVGLLIVSVCRARFTYYLTNFRVLVSERRFWRKDRWLMLRYENVEHFSWHGGMLGIRLTFSANDRQTEFRGISGKGAATMNQVLREHLPTEVYAKCAPLDLLSPPVL